MMVDIRLGVLIAYVVIFVILLSAAAVIAAAIRNGQIDKDKK